MVARFNPRRLRQVRASRASCLRLLWSFLLFLQTPAAQQQRTQTPARLKLAFLSLSRRLILKLAKRRRRKRLLRLSNRSQARRRSQETAQARDNCLRRARNLRSPPRLRSREKRPLPPPDNCRSPHKRTARRPASHKARVVLIKNRQQEELCISCEAISSRALRSGSFCGFRSHPRISSQSQARSTVNQTVVSEVSPHP